MQRIFVQYRVDGSVEGVVEGFSIDPVHPRQVDATNRTDGPWSHKTYVPALDAFYDPKTHCVVGGAITVLPSSLLSVDIVTQKWDGAAWVVEPIEFTVGDKVRIEATIKNPDSSTYTGPGSNIRFRVPIFVGRQGPPNPDGSQTVVPTEDLACVIPLQFNSGVAVFDFIAAQSMWICAVAGRTSAWLKTTVVRAVIAKAAP